MRRNINYLEWAVLVCLTLLSLGYFISAAEARETAVAPVRHEAVYVLGVLHQGREP